MLRHAPTGILFLAWMLFAETAAAMAPRQLAQKEHSGTLPFANPGLIFDPAGQAGHDQQGISLEISQATYGRKAEERLDQSSRGRAVLREFWQGKEAACSLPRQTCWQDGCSRSGGFGSGSSNSRLMRALVMSPPPATIVLPYAGSCVTFGGRADSFRLNLNRGQWLQVQAVDRGIALLAPSGRSLPSAYGSGEWHLPESGTYGVKLEVPPGEGLGVRFCLR